MKLMPTLWLVFSPYLRASRETSDARHQWRIDRVMLSMDHIMATTDNNEPIWPLLKLYQPTTSEKIRKIVLRKTFCSGKMNVVEVDNRYG